ncbi:hypothetical protein [Mesoplasma photuris]|uniref:hypothetical protein n=1 Tax=Mesoplasma photuris TaxID=217731 RepID=UPI0004E20EA1|nr:hypothetical protein [Mesoplasma photuris]
MRADIQNFGNHCIICNLEITKEHKSIFRAVGSYRSGLEGIQHLGCSNAKRKANYGKKSIALIISGVSTLIISLIFMLLWITTTSEQGNFLETKNSYFILMVTTGVIWITNAIFIIIYQTKEWNKRKKGFYKNDQIYTTKEIQALKKERELVVKIKPNHQNKKQSLSSLKALKLLKLSVNYTKEELNNALKENISQEKDTLKYPIILEAYNILLAELED